MKITIAFLPEEAEKAHRLATAMRNILDVEKVRESASHAPYFHIYMTTRKPESRCGPRGIT